MSGSVLATPAIAGATQSIKNSTIAALASGVGGSWSGWWIDRWSPTLTTMSARAGKDDSRGPAANDPLGLCHSREDECMLVGPGSAWGGQGCDGLRRESSIRR